MTLPSEQLRSLATTRQFLRDLSTGPRLPMLVLRSRARQCLRHYPGSYTLATRWADDVCEHGQDRQWCGQCKARCRLHADADSRGVLDSDNDDMATGGLG